MITSSTNCPPRADTNLYTFGGCYAEPELEAESTFEEDDE